MSSIDLGDQRVPIEATPRFNSDDNFGKRALLKTDEARRASAFATGHLLADFAATSQSPQAVENAARIMGDLAEDLGEAAPAAVAPVVAAPPAEAPAVAVQTDYELPAEVAAMLDEPDEPNFDEPELEPEPLAAVEPDEDSYADPEIARLRRELAAEKKRAEHERGLRVQTARGGWEAEATRVFQINGIPLLSADDLSKIDADSHKDFLRKAKAKADENKQIAQRFTQPILETRDLRVEQWGTPPVGEPAAAPDSVGRQQNLDRARRSGRLAEVLKAHLYG